MIKTPFSSRISAGFSSVRVIIKTQIGDKSASKDPEYSGSNEAELTSIWGFILTLTQPGKRHKNVGNTSDIIGRQD
jgi:hypothetical protein